MALASTISPSPRSSSRATCSRFNCDVRSLMFCCSSTARGPPLLLSSISYSTRNWDSICGSFSQLPQWRRRMRGAHLILHSHKPSQQRQHPRYLFSLLGWFLKFLLCQNRQSLSCSMSGLSCILEFGDCRRQIRRSSRGRLSQDSETKTQTVSCKKAYRSTS